MSWNTTENTQASQEQKTFVACNGNKYNISGIDGIGLCEKLKSLARENQISKFDVFDENNKNLSADDIESGNYLGNLTISRFNVAA